jgi:hypothetical protein
VGGYRTQPFGIANINVGSSDTRATNHDCNKNSRHANGLRGISTKVSNAVAKNPHRRTGFACLSRQPPVDARRDDDRAERAGRILETSPRQVRACFGGRPGTIATDLHWASVPTTTQTAPAVAGASAG